MPCLSNRASRSTARECFYLPTDNITVPFNSHFLEYDATARASVPSSMNTAARDSPIARTSSRITQHRDPHRAAAVRAMSSVKELQSLPGVTAQPDAATKDFIFQQVRPAGWVAVLCGEPSIACTTAHPPSLSPPSRWQNRVELARHAAHHTARRWPHHHPAMLAWPGTRSDLLAWHGMAWLRCADTAALLCPAPADHAARA
jgi:hypothetical protein